MANATKKEIEELKKDLNSLKTNVVELTKSLKQDAVHKASDNVELLRKKGNDAIDAVEQNVKNHPGQSVLLAFLGGMLASALLRR